MLKSALIALLQAIPEDYEVVAGHDGPQHWHEVVGVTFPENAVIFPADDDITYYSPYRTYTSKHDGHVVLPIVFLELSLFRTPKEQ